MVEVVTLRYVQRRDVDGNVHYVPNGHTSTVINMTRGFSNAVMDIGVAYRENVDEVVRVMADVARDMRADPTLGASILADLEIAGIEIPYPHLTVYADQNPAGKAPAFRVRPLEAA